MSYPQPRQSSTSPRSDPTCFQICQPAEQMPGDKYQKLSALELARQIEADELSPSAVLDLCADAIAAHGNAVGAFASLDIQQARKTVEFDSAALRLTPLRG